MCLSEPDIAELWRLHYEVYTVHCIIHHVISLFTTCTQETNLGGLQRIFPAKGSSHKYHQYFSNGVSKIDEIVAKWAEL